MIHDAPDSGTCGSKEHKEENILSLFKNKESNRRVIDIHSHILPGIDDGSGSWETSMEMMRIAWKDGITDMIATPHYKSGRHNASPRRVKALADELQDRIGREGIDIKIHIGNEIMYFSEAADALDNGDILTMCDSDYVLVEFLPGDNFRHISAGLDDLRYMGYEPILAHVERYECMLRDIKNVQELYRRDITMQANAASITGALGAKVKKSVIRMIDEGYIDYIGTDAHDTGKRSPVMSKCIKLLGKRYVKEDVDDLICANALDIIEDNQ